MKNYDFKKAKQIIAENKGNLKSADLGMHEDWFWTACTIWEDGEYKKELPDNAKELQERYIEARKNGLSMFLKEKDDNGLAKFNPEYDKLTTHQINGLYGSDWATPVIRLEFNNGTSKMIECHDGGESSGCAPFGIHSVLSGPVQENITPITK